MMLCNFATTLLFTFPRAFNSKTPCYLRSETLLLHTSPTHRPIPHIPQPQERIRLHTQPAQLWKNTSVSPSQNQRPLTSHENPLRSPAGRQCSLLSAKAKEIGFLSRKRRPELKAQRNSPLPTPHSRARSTHRGSQQMQTASSFRAEGLAARTRNGSSTALRHAKPLERTKTNIASSQARAKRGVKTIATLPAVGIPMAVPRSLDLLCALMEHRARSGPSYRAMRCVCASRALKFFLNGWNHLPKGSTYNSGK